MKPKPNTKVGNNNPGPGNYNASKDVVKDRVVSHKISKSMREDIVSKSAKDMPGPGNYHSTAKFG